MEITLGWIAVIIAASSGFLPLHGVSGFQVKTGRFQMLQRHRHLRKCAARFLHEDEFVGCRVSEQTGQCQGLPHSWGLNPTMEQGYSYAKKVLVQERFQPQPVTLQSSSLHWNIPVVLNTGAQIDVFLSLPNCCPGVRDVILLDLANTTFSHTTLSYSNYMHLVRFRVVATQFWIYELNGPYITRSMLGHFASDRLPAPFSSKEIFKISFLAQPNSLAIFVGDEEEKAFNLSTHIRKMNTFIISQGHKELDPKLIHGIKFTGK